MTKRRKRPSSPEEIARLAAERRQIEADVVRLRDTGAIVELNAGGRIERSYRPDVFQLLATRGHKSLSQDCYLSARRLQDDVAQMRGEDQDHSYIQRDRVARSITPVTDRSLIARDRVLAAVGAIGIMDGRMMLALCTDHGGLITRWRDLVRQETGETHEHAQAARVRSACQRLTDWYRQLDYGIKKSA